MRAVRVHLHDDVIAALQGPGEARDVGLAQPGFLGPVHDVHVRIGLSELLSQVARAVRAVVIDDQQVRVWRRLPDPPCHDLKVLPLVVRRHHDEHSTGG